MGWEVSLIVPLLTAAVYMLFKGRRHHGRFLAYILMFMLVGGAIAAAHVAAHLGDAMTAATAGLGGVLSAVLIMVFLILDVTDRVKRW